MKTIKSKKTSRMVLPALPLSVGLSGSAYATTKVRTDTKGDPAQSHHAPNTGSNDWISSRLVREHGRYDQPILRNDGKRIDQGVEHNARILLNCAFLDPGYSMLDCREDKQSDVINVKSPFRMITP